MGEGSMSKPKCIYKNNLDGWAAAALIKQQHKMAEMYPVNDIEEADIDFKKDNVLFIFGLTFHNSDRLKEVKDNASVFQWVDHHQESKELYDANISEFKTVNNSFKNKAKKAFIDPNYGTSELAYKELMNVEYDKVPYWYKLLSRYEKREFQDKNVKPFQYGIRTFVKDPKISAVEWKRIVYNLPKDQEFFNSLIEKGKWIIEYEKRRGSLEVRPEDLR